MIGLPDLSVTPFFLLCLHAITVLTARQTNAKKLQVYIWLIPDFIVNNPLHIAAALERLSVRNTTQARVTKTKVIAAFTLSPSYLNLLPNALLTQLAIPCRAPQMINVQPAPCHSPDTSMTNKRLKYVLAVPFLLPPRGIYK